MMIWSCASPYEALTPVSLDRTCLERIRPGMLQTSWYDASVDVVGKHISGLLLVKQMPDNSTRVVFTNEAGVKFFDFEYLPDGKFKVRYAMDMLDRRVVLNLLRKDFELILQKPFEGRAFAEWKNRNDYYFGVKDGKVNHYYVTSDCQSLKIVESGSKKKKMVTLKIFGKDATSPDSLLLEHYTFSMNMKLKKITRG